MTDIKQFAAPERRLDDIREVQQPVADNSEAMFFNTASNLVKGGAQVKSAFDRAEVSEAKSAQTAMENEWGLALSEAADLSSQAKNQAQKDKAETRLMQTRNDLVTKGFSAKTADKMMNTFEGTFMGASLTEKTQQEVIREAQIKDASKAGYVTPEMDELQIAQATSKYISDGLNRQARADQKAQLELRISKGNLAKSEREQAQTELDRLNTKIFAEEALARYTPITNDINSILLDGSMTPTEKRLKLQEKRGELNLSVTQFGSKGNREQIDYKAKPLFDLYDRALTFVNDEPGKVLEELEDANKTAKAKIEQNLMNSNPELLRLSVFADKFDASNLGSFALRLDEEVMKEINKQSTPDGNPANLVTDNESDIKKVETYFDVMRQQFKAEGKVDYKGDPRVDQQLTTNNMHNVVKSVGKYVQDIDDFEGSARLMKFLAEAPTGKWLKSNPAPPAVVTQAAINMGRMLDSVIVPSGQALINELITFPEETTPVQPTRSGRSTVRTPASEGPRERTRSGRSFLGDITINDINVSVSRGKLQFSATDPKARGAAERLNKDFAAAVSTYANAWANIEGSNPDEIINRVLDNVGLGEGQDNTPEVTSPETPQQVEVGMRVPEDKVDGSYNYGEGRIAIVRNGVVVEVRADGN